MPVTRIKTNPVNVHFNGIFNGILLNFIKVLFVLLKYSHFSPFFYYFDDFS